jgi:hypothetical protein
MRYKYQPFYSAAHDKLTPVKINRNFGCFNPLSFCERHDSFCALCNALRDLRNMLFKFNTTSNVDESQCLVEQYPPSLLQQQVQQQQQQQHPKLIGVNNNILSTSNSTYTKRRSLNSFNHPKFTPTYKRLQCVRKRHDSGPPQLQQQQQVLQRRQHQQRQPLVQIMRRNINHKITNRNRTAEQNIPFNRRHNFKQHFQHHHQQSQHRQQNLFQRHQRLLAYRRQEVHPPHHHQQQQLQHYNNHHRQNNIPRYPQMYTHHHQHEHYYGPTTKTNIYQQRQQRRYNSY